MPTPAPQPLYASTNGDGGADGEPHTAPHDEIITVVRQLMATLPPGRDVNIDNLSNALKARGFSRPPGSPRLITRLRRIKEIDVSRTGVITLRGDVSPSEPSASGEAGSSFDEPIGLGDEPEAPAGAEAGEGGEGEGQAGPRPRRRRRRGGRRRRGRGSGASASATS
jgi:hypothetical protein